MTVIATAVGTAIGATAIGGAAVGGLTGLGLSAGLATGVVGAATLAGVGGLGAMLSDSISEDAAAQQADKRQGIANAAVSGTAAPGAASMYSAPTTPISSGGQQYFATGGLTALAKGGSSVNLQDSDYIIPADVVSALGNGSSKAGARYLDEQFARLNSVGGVGALPESRKLMATRAKKKNPKAT